jgi:hypothetical protein
LSYFILSLSLLSIFAFSVWQYPVTWCHSLHSKTWPAIGANTYVQCASEFNGHFLVHEKVCFITVGPGKWPFRVAPIRLVVNIHTGRASEAVSLARWSSARRNKEKDCDAAWIPSRIERNLPISSSRPCHNRYFITIVLQTVEPPLIVIASKMAESIEKLFHSWSSCSNRSETDFISMGLTIHQKLSWTLYFDKHWPE